MSCILYNLAIEPLAILLQASTLKGFPIKGLIERILITLFADDTIVYLDDTDNFLTLQSKLQLFCTASGSKFNLEKTEILPLGTPEYRKKFLTT